MSAPRMIRVNRGPTSTPWIVVAITAAVLVLAAARPLAAQTGNSLRLTLTDAVDLALRRGFGARAADATLEAAQARRNEFSARLRPQLTLSGDVPAFNRSIVEVVQPDGGTLFRAQNQTSAALTATVTQRLPMTGGEMFVRSSLTRLSVSGGQEVLTWNSTPVSVGIRQPILRPNTIRWDAREQPLRVEAAARRHAETRENLAVQAANRFFALYAAQVDLATASANAAVNDTLYTLNRGRYNIGNIGENDLLQSELALLGAQTAVDAAMLEVNRAAAALRIALNLPPDAPLAIVVPTAIPAIDPDTSVAVEQALRNRAAMREADLQHLQADRQVTQAKLANGLGATLEASYGFNATGADVTGAYADLLEAQRLRVAVEVPLLQWGARGAAVTAAEMEREAATNTTELTHRQVAHEARFAALELAQARRAVAFAVKEDSVSVRRFDVAYNRYVIGRISLDNLFMAQREKDQAREGYVRALSGYWDAYYRLRAVTLYDFERGEPLHR